MKWFKHDSNAHTDTKLKKLRHRYGIEGYGLYWYCLELIAGKVDKSNITFELEDDAQTIARDWGMDQIRVQEMMQYMCELRLFSSDNGTISCLKLAKRLDDTNAKNPEIKAIIDLLSRTNSEEVGETPNDSDQTRLDEIRLEEKEEASLDDGKQKTFDAFMATCKQIGVKPIPEDDAAWKYAEKMKITPDMVRAAWYRFKNKYRGNKKRYIDWRKAFLNALRDNWYKIWWFDANGHISWTSAGQQALLAMKNDAEGDL